MYDSGKNSLKSENEQRTIIAHSGCHHPPHHGQWLDGTGPPRKKGGVETQSGTQCQVLLRPKSPRDLTSTSTLCRLQLDSKQNTKSTLLSQTRVQPWHIKKWIPPIAFPEHPKSLRIESHDMTAANLSRLCSIVEELTRYLEIVQNSTYSNTENFSTLGTASDKCLLSLLSRLQSYMLTFSIHALKGCNLLLIVFLHFYI
jgi:hypothetical protein